MPRTEVYQLRLTKDEKDELVAKAKEVGLSVAGLIRTEVGLSVARSSMAEHSTVNREVEGSSPSAPVETWTSAQPPEPVERETKLKTLANHFFARGMTSRQAKLEAERKIDG